MDCPNCPQKKQVKENNRFSSPVFYFYLKPKAMVIINDLFHFLNVNTTD